MSAVTSTTTENYYVSSTDESDSSTDTSNDSLTQEDFMLLLITELQNQDPLEPVSNSDLCSQVTEMEALNEQIAQTEALETMSENISSLTDYLATMTYDNRLQSASALVGSYVSGTSDSGDTVEGMVLSATMNSGDVTLTLHSGDTLSYDNVTDVTMAVYDEDEETTETTE